METSHANSMHLAPLSAKRRSLFALALLLGLFVVSGASCRQWVRQQSEPRTLPPTPTLDQVVTTVNDNSSRVQSLQSTQAALSIPGVPTSLRANVALQSPRRLRLSANSPFGKPELDLGSNDEIFWLWIGQQQPPAVFVCRHDQFAVSNARQIMPVEPEWLIEAVGLPRLDMSQPLEGPTPVGNGRLQIRSRQATAMGVMTKDTMIDEWDGTVQEQLVYDPQGKLLARATTSKHKRDPLSGAALPRSIDINWPTNGMSFHLDISDWRVNSITPENGLALFTKPEYPGYAVVNLAEPGLQFIQPGNPPQTLPMAVPQTLPPTTFPPTAYPPNGAAPPVAPMPFTAAPPTLVTPAAAGRVAPR